MILNRRKRKLGLATGIIAGSLLLAACDDGSMNADLRVIHASDDAPPVNVRVGKKKLISDLDYAESSGYVAVRSGTKKVTVEAIIPSGNANVIEVKRFKFNRDTRYNILAVNKTADIAPLVVEETAAEPDLDEVAIAVVHAAPGVGMVDVYVTGPNDLLNGTTPTFTFDFEGVVDAGALPAGSPYRIRVAGMGETDPDDPANLAYDSGTLDLSGFAGDKILLAALLSENETEKAASPIKLLAANDIAQVELLDSATLVGARVVHLSPDAGTLAGGPVEVFATSAALPGTVELIPAFSYEDIVPAGGATYVPVPSGDYVFNVAPDGAGVPGVYTSPSLTLSTGMEYSVIAAGLVGGGPDFTLLATADHNRSIITQSSVKIIHGAPAAGLVDVFVTPAGAYSAAQVIAGDAGAPLLDDFAFADITDYVSVPPGNYDIRVIAGGAAAIDVPNFALTPGLVATVIARQADGVGSPSPFNLVLLTN